ncbi:MAG: hypothetical protein WBC65_08935, partial [Ignavibacteria bacterium]
NAHSVANYCVIRDLSEEIFEKEFVNDTEQWSVVSLKSINKASVKLLEKNTEDLMNAGSEVVSIIKP